MSQTTITLIVTLLAVLFGAATGLFIMQVSSVVAEIPVEDRRYKDPPPLGFRLFWWPIQWCSYPLSRFVSQEATSRLPTRLRKAGLEFSLSAPQFVAGRLLWGLVAAALAVGVLKLLGQGPSGDFGAVTASRPN